LVQPPPNNEIILGADELKYIDDIVDYYSSNTNLQELLTLHISGLLNCFKVQALASEIHSVRSRIKNPDHLRGKLIRKYQEAKAKGIEFDITKQNLTEKVNDLAGLRIIHLHRKQVEKINTELKKTLADFQWQIIEGPIAKTWDDDSRAYFNSIGFTIEENKNMYTSVHYVIKPNSGSITTCEIQVRTLMEEVWGEVDHTINYPYKTESIACREQIKALAHATSSCSSLVNSIFTSFEDYQKPVEKIIIPDDSISPKSIKPAAIKNVKRKTSGKSKKSNSKTRPRRSPK
jgi:putative GTP pyrophosphokinase